MSDRKVFIFGSFTEDESRLIQSLSSQKPAPPLEKGGCEHASEKLAFQFGSLDIASLSSIKGFGTDSKQTGSTIGSRDIHSSNLTAKDSTLRNGKPAVHNDLRKTCQAQSNGMPNGCSSVSGFSVNGVNNLDLNLANMGENRLDNVEPPCLDQKHIGKPVGMSNDTCEGSNNGSKLSDTPTVATPVVDARRKLNEKASPARTLLSRGLINLGNMCFLNATLQALLSCSPFVQLLQDLANRDIPKVGYPTLLAFVEFISEFGIPHDAKENKRERGLVESGKPFSPLMFDSVLKIFTPDLPSGLSGRPRQEDAQEFLSFVMDRMHDELLKLEGHCLSSNGGSLPLVSSSEDDGWETVGPRNKSAIIRTQSFIPSELSAIFGGQLMSEVKARGNKPSVTVQPFLLLHLDILSEAVHTIEDALHLFSAPETLEGYRGSAGKAGVVNASKSVKIQALSKILILHLMRFSYGSEGSTKLHKPVHFPLELVLGRDLLVTPSAEGRRYELVATITHHGQEPSKGHYTADTRYSDNQWLRYDDASVTSVGTNKVLHEQAYVLFYKQV